MDIKSSLINRTADISAMVTYWEKVTNIVNGLEYIRRAREDYLPKFPNELEDDYNFRLSLGKFTNIYRDVLEGLATKPFEEEITLIGGESIPDSITDFVENVDGSGTHLSQFAALTFFNGINYALDWIFIDYPSITTNRPLNRAEVKEMKIKPFWSHVLAKNVCEVRTEIFGSEEVLSYIRIREPALLLEDEKVRIFERNGNVVTWSLWQEGIQIDGGQLSINRIPLVPFITGRRDGRTWKFFPVMQDAADLQITLYQNETQLEYVKTLAGYPMLAANGMRPEKGSDGKPVKVAIGPGRIMYGVPDGAGNHGEWRFIEPSANSLEFLKKDIAQTKQDLRELGRQPLTALSTQLTTTTTSIAAGKARSAVTAWALSLKDALENALVITAMFMGIKDYDPEVNVYTGFDNVLDDGSDLETLNAARDRRDLSQETYLFELKRRKVLSPEFKYEDELKRIMNEIPSEEADSPLTTPEDET